MTSERQQSGLWREECHPGVSGVRSVVATGWPRGSLVIWRSRAGNYRVMCNASLKTTSNAAVSNKVFLRVRCESCHAEHLVAFSCKRRGFCPSCGARRMAESAALLVDEVLQLRKVLAAANGAYAK